MKLEFKKVSSETEVAQPAAWETKQKGGKITWSALTQ